ncbi:hypothetical protein LCGC14_2909800, partial [marine sediment metagenome]
MQLMGNHNQPFGEYIPIIAFGVGFRMCHFLKTIIDDIVQVFDYFVHALPPSKTPGQMKEGTHPS